MVLHKRKPVGFATPPDGLSDSQEVWSIAATGEVFTEYEKFLKRMDFLSQKKFTDAVNGKSGLSFFAAQEQEDKSSEAIESVFPECLRDPILRKVQFSTVGRMDDLVNLVFDEFKKDFFPGENVIIVYDNGDTIQGTVREKAKFPMIRGPDGEVQRYGFSRYFVRMGPDPLEEALTDEKHLRRDRKIFTKQNLRSFLKNSLQREPWNGAPWLVKEHLAIHYRLPMEIPMHLLQDYKVLQQKQSVLQSKPGAKAKKKIAVEDIIRPSIEEHRTSQTSTMPGEALPTKEPQQGYHAARLPAALEALKGPSLPVKYPIEDLDLPPKQDGVTRPQLSFFTDQMKTYIMHGRKKQPQDMQFDTLSMLLEIWNTLNVQCEVYVLDSFTFDDFVDAMRYNADEPECELLNEVFCAVLKQLVSETGKLEVALPNSDDTESESESDTSRMLSEPQTPIDDPPARSTRSSRPSAVSLNGIKAESPSITKVHRASELLEGFDWQARLAAREVEEGGWQMILVGLLSQLSYSPQHKPRMDKILTYLVPLEEEPSRENLVQHFTSMDINLKTLALQVITALSISTRALKDFLETCSEDQTDVRKRKIEFQRERKQVMEELAAKDRERKILLPDNMLGTPEPEAELATPDVDMDETMEDEHDSDSDVDTGRTLRRNAGRKRKREEELVRAEKERADRARQAANAPKQSKEFLKILKDIEKLRAKIEELEFKILECDNDLREANVQRTRVLGTDRYCNRYYWFERNGQPFGGLPTSSTADYGYANGRIWVQGPDDMEREGFIDLSYSQQADYQARFRMTVPERRKQEEGATILQNAREWGYYDDSDRLDSLIAWLDERGEREKKLQKELRDWHDEIVKHMDIRKRFLDDEAVKKSEAEDEQATRITTRHAVQKDRSAAAERCLRWSNTMAIAEEKHLHSQNAPRAKPKKQQAKGVAILTSRTKASTRSSFGR